MKRTTLYLAVIIIISILFACTEEAPVTLVSPVIDHIAPYVEWVDPESGSELSGTVELVFSVYDENVIDSVRLLKNGAAVATIFPPYDSRGGQRGGREFEAEYLWNTLPDSDGIYILEARAWDEAGNMGVSPSLLVRVRNDEEPPPEDRLPPDVWWISPDGGSTLSGTVSLQVRFFDESGVDSVRLLKNGATVATYIPPGSRGGSEGGVMGDTITHIWNTLTDSDGVYIWEARVWDASGNTGVSPSLLVRVRNDEEPPEDLTPPVVVWRSPEGGSEVSGTVDLRFDALDNVAIDSLKIYLNGSCPEGFEMAGHPEAEYSVLWDTENIEDGVYIWEARAWDASGNLGISPSLMVNVKNNPDPPPEDRLPPDVWWISPDGGSTLSGTVSLQLRFYDESSIGWVRLLKNGAAVAVYMPPYDSSGVAFEVEYLWDTESDSDGVYVWEARAWDSSYNIGISPSLLIRVRNNEEPPPEDHAPPVVTWLSPEPGSTVEGVVELRFQVMDDVGLDSVKVYLNGRIFEKLESMGNFLDGEAIWVTSDYPDGNYIVEVRAWDSAGNMGVGVGVVLTVRNNVPRVIWVPDDFEKIQDAINASEDGDTVRVRAGTYREELRLMGKNIWLESEAGPEVTTINSTEFGTGIISWDGENGVIRGFTVISDWHGINIVTPSQTTVYNCILKNCPRYGIWLDDSNGSIYNSVIERCGLEGNGAEGGLAVAYSQGVVKNNIFINNRYGINEFRLWEPKVEFGWNLFWQNSEGNYIGMEPVQTDIYADPMFQLDSYRLQDNSPAIDAGDPDILDPDGSRSDIGVHGGPHSY